MKEAPEFFKSVLDRLLSDVIHTKDPVKSRVSSDSLAAEIRAFRKRIVAVYYLEAHD